MKQDPQEGVDGEMLKYQAEKALGPLNTNDAI